MLTLRGPQMLIHCTCYFLLLHIVFSLLLLLLFSRSPRIYLHTCGRPGTHRAGRQLILLLLLLLLLVLRLHQHRGLEKQVFDSAPLFLSVVKGPLLLFLLQLQLLC